MWKPDNGKRKRRKKENRIQYPVHPRNGSAPPRFVDPRNQVLQEFDGRLGALQNVSLSGGRLSYTTPTFAATFGGDVAQFFKTIAENHKLHGRLDAVLKGNLMLRNCLPDAPPSADRVVMEVVSTTLLSGVEVDWRRITRGRTTSLVLRMT